MERWTESINYYICDQAQYTELLKAYQSSPAYLQWLAHKTRGTIIYENYPQMQNFVFNIPRHHYTACF